MLNKTLNNPILKMALEAYPALSEGYAQSWGLTCLLVDASGALLAGQATGDHASFRLHAVEEALRWGEPSLLLTPDGIILWAVPVMHNGDILGGLVVERAESDAPELSPAETRRAMAALLTLAEITNLTNAALLELRRRAARLESERAEAIHDLKGQNYQSIRDVYLIEEPALISAIKRGDRAAAREILNRVLVGIYFLGQGRPMLLKSFLLELVVTMSRCAVEAGADPTELLGANYSSFTELADIEGEEELCSWLVKMLERMMDAITANNSYPSSILIAAALKYMQEHLSEELTRDEVATIACLSPSHFSRVFKQTIGRPFTELLAVMRVDKARELLVLSEKSLIQICFDCGFKDQSYFTKVFQKITGQTPGEYRRSQRNVLR